MIDSKATANFILEEFIQHHQISTEQKVFADLLLLVDEMKHSVTYQMQALQLSHSEITKIIILNIMLIDDHNVILDMS